MVEVVRREGSRTQRPLTETPFYANMLHGMGPSIYYVRTKLRISTPPLPPVAYRTFQDPPPPMRTYTLPPPHIINVLNGRLCK